MKIDLLLMSSSDESGKLLLDRSSPGVSYELKRQATYPPCVQHTVLGQGLHVCKHFCRKMGDGGIVAFLTWSKSEIFMSCVNVPYTGNCRLSSVRARCWSSGLTSQSGDLCGSWLPVLGALPCPSLSLATSEVAVR